MVVAIELCVGSLRGKMPRLRNVVVYAGQDATPTRLRFVLIKRVGIVNDAFKVYILLHDWDSPFVSEIEKMLTCTAGGL